MTFRALQQRTLRLSVYDVDRSKRHKLIGHALYPLKDLDYETHQKVVMWLDLEKEVQEVMSIIVLVVFYLFIFCLSFAGRGLTLFE